MTKVTTPTGVGISTILKMRSRLHGNLDLKGKTSKTLHPVLPPPVGTAPPGDPGRGPKSTKKRHGKRVPRKRSQNRPWELHGAPQGAPGAQTWPKLDTKGPKKESKHSVFLRFGRINGKYDETSLFTIYQAHQPPQKMPFLSYLRRPKLTWEPKGDHIKQKCC